MELPQYQCHKVVRAAKIMGVMPGGTALGVQGGDGKEVSVDVTNDWLAKHSPEVGGYYVLYEDGYASYSPAQAFEEGYTKVPTEAGTLGAIHDHNASAGVTRQGPKGFNIAEVFHYHAPKGDQQHRYVTIRDSAKRFAELLTLLTPASAEQTLALRDLQRCVMMANAAIAINEAEP